MGFTEIENVGKKVLEQFPFIKRSCKRLYQLVSIGLSNKKLKPEGDIICVSPEDDGYEYFYGYYDKSPWDADDRYIIALKVKQAYKFVAPKEPGDVVLIDTTIGNQVIKIATTNAWNVQQGCMAQWLGPDFKSRIIYNDFRDGNYCSVVFNVETMKQEKVFPLPIYDVAKDGSFALSLDFSRLHRLRPGYGYSNLKDANAKERCPEKTCIWRMELSTGKVTELLKYTDMAAFEPDESMIEAEHKVNHLMISPNGQRFMVLHRWYQKGRKYTRLVTINSDGTQMYNLSDDVFVSHCYWKNNEEILSFLRKNETGDHYYLMKDRTQEYKMFWPELRTDGHCSYSLDGKYIITDTYPNRKRLASTYLCTEDGGIQGVAKRIARVFAPFKYDNDCRCDLHPRWNHAGNKICIDSTHDGIRRLYVIPVDCGQLMKVHQPEQMSKVTVVMATYNGEEYLDEQLQSLIEQKNVQLEILIRDDGSSDRTHQILDKWQEEGKLKWYNGEHVNVQRGYYHLLTTASKSDSPYYAFCDQDDVWDKNKLEIAIAALEKLPAIVPALYYCGQRLVDQDLSFIANHTLNTKRSFPTRYVISDIAGCTAVFNRCLLDKLMEYEPSFMLMHDSWIFKVCLSLGGNIVIDEQCHISYRQHGNNVAGIGTGIRAKFIQIHKYIYKFEIQRQIQELNKGYRDQMVPDYKKLTDAICDYQSNSDSQKLLLDKNYINFNNKGLNATFYLKVKMKKL